MAARKDQVQISIAFLTDESKEYAKLIQENQKFVADIQKAKKEGKDLTGVIRQMAASGQDISKIPLDKLAPSQLVARANQLKQVLFLIPQSAPEYAQLAAEYKKINDLLAEQRVRTRGVAEAMSSMRGGASGLFGVMARGTAIIASVVAAAQGFFRVLSGASKMEQFNIAFEVFLGSADKAKRVLADLRRFADFTPFETEQVNNAGRALLAFGFSTEELIPTLTRVGDVAAGTGKDFNELALIYGKAKTQGLIQGEELNQLAEAGIPIYAELAKILGVNENQIRKLGENGKITFASLEQVFKNLTSEGGRFAGLMERQSKSLDGLFSTLVSLVQTKLTGAMNDLLPVIKAITKGFIDFLSVPMSATLEQERQAFNGLALGILNAKEGTEARTRSIRSLQEQYPAFLGNIDAEKITNEQLKPILDQINQSYVIRIALQKQQEKLQPLLEAQAEQENRLAEGRAAANRLLARGAELAGVNLQQFQTQAEQTQAVIAGLNQTAQFRSAGGFDQPLNEQARVLNQIKANLSGIDATTVRTKFATQQATEAEKQRQEVVAELRKTYSEVFAILDKENEKTANGKNADAAGVAASKAAADAKKLQEVIALELQEVDIQFAKEELTALKLKQDGILADETKFGNVMVILEEQQLEARLAVYRRYGQDQTKEALDLQAKLLEIQTGRQQRPTVAPLDALPNAGPAPVQSQGKDRIEALAQASGNAEVSAIRDKFAQIVDLEQQHELRIAEIRRNAADERLRMLLEAGLSETEEYKKAQQEKLKADEDYSKKRLENEQRTAELKKKVEQASTAATADAFAVAVELLSQDEKARKRNASAIKAFQSAQVITNGILEVQKIWASVAEFGPAAPVIGGILTAVAVARAGIALGKIQATKFAGGGYTGPGAGVPVDSTGHRPVGVVHNDEWVGPKWMTQHPVWGHQIAVLESVRQRGYAQGGYATTPTVNIVPGAAAGSAGAASMEGLVALADEFRGFRREIRDWQGRLRVSYTDIEDVGSEVSKVRTEASI